MREPRMSKLATYCMNGLEEALPSLEWIGDVIGWFCLTFLATLFCLFTWPFGLYRWFKGGNKDA